jgi:hypothetical protein
MGWDCPIPLGALVRAEDKNRLKNRKKWKSRKCHQKFDFFVRLTKH